MEEKIYRLLVLRRTNMNSNDASGLRPAAEFATAQVSEQQRQRQTSTSQLQGSRHCSHHNFHVYTAGPSICKCPPSPSPHEQDLPSTPAKPEPAYLSPLPSHQSSPFSSSAATLNECCAPRTAQAPAPKKKMGLTKTQRIGILLGIDSAFFIVELVVGT